MQLPSIAPHDFFLTFDVDDYWEAEYDPEVIVAHGYARPLALSTRDVLAVVKWNEDPEAPVFDVSFPDAELAAAEQDEAKRLLSRILGTGLELRGLMDQAADDRILGPLLAEHYGLKRLARANLWEECVDDFIRSRIRHRPTARRMSQDVRRTYGSTFVHEGRNYYAYPRPEALAGVDPETFREFGISRRKGEYMVGLAQLIVDGEFDVEAHETMEPDAFYESIQKVRGIGPATAQELMHVRARPDCSFPSNRDKDGNEKGLRRWLVYAYGEDPNQTDQARFEALLVAWHGYEAMALRFLYLDWILTERQK